MSQLTWPEVVDACRELAAKVRDSGYQPNLLVAVARGGWVPTRLLSDFLEVKRIASVGRVYSFLALDRSDRILLIEDMLETGASLAQAASFFRSGGAEVRTCALYYRTHSKLLPDYSLGQIDHCPTFPWEVSP